MRHLFLSSAGSRLPVPVAVLALALALAGCGGPDAGTAASVPSAAAGAQDVQAVAPETAPATAPATAPETAPATGPVGSGPSPAGETGTAAGTPAPSPSAPADLPGLGPRTLAEVPDTARQVLIVTGKDKDSSQSQVVLYERRTADSGWTAGRTWAAHNALKGWTDDHYAGDLHSPIGVFTLSDAGGLLADPGTKLPYDRSGSFTIGGTGFEGEPLAGSFDYVVAIDYNREPGTSPLDWTRPLGTNRGGGIWLHVDHGGPTHGCVSLAKQHMKELLLALDPALHPVIVMGDRTSLER
ncbi:L,D-transpeptidase family protein [Streptomyces sp. NPDC002623]